MPRESSSRGSRLRASNGEFVLLLVPDDGAEAGENAFTRVGDTPGGGPYSNLRFDSKWSSMRPRMSSSCK